MHGAVGGPATGPHRARRARHASAGLAAGRDDRPRPRRRRSFRRRTAAPAWAGSPPRSCSCVGAAIGLSQLSHSAKHDTAALKTSKAAGGTEAEAAAPSTTAIAATDLGDLGALTDTAALRARVQPTVAQLQAAAPSAPNAAAPKVEGTVPGSAGTKGEFGTGDRAAGRRCVAAARALDPANVSPAAVGTATWQGTPAEVLVYAVAGRPGAARVYVLAQTGCRVLEFQSYAP